MFVTELKHYMRCLYKLLGVTLKKLGDGDPSESSVYFNEMPLTPFMTLDDLFDYTHDFCLNTETKLEHHH